MSEKNLWQTFGAVAKDKSFPYFSGLRFSTFLHPKNVSLLLSLHNTCNTGRKCTGKKLMENMMTTAINILATFRLVFNWLSRLRLAEFIDATPLLESSVFRLTNRMVVLQVLKMTEIKPYLPYIIASLHCVWHRCESSVGKKKTPNPLFSLPIKEFSMSVGQADGSCIVLVILAIVSRWCGVVGGGGFL